jgi:diadenosine tetraphosphate (Ap4A) HIT family hydrolase
MDFFILWENDVFIISTPHNPHLAYDEGLHVIISPKHRVSSAWENPDLSAGTFKLAAQACKIMEALNLAPWFNIQANGNWGLLPGRKPSFHVHILGRNKTDSWGGPVVLPEAPGTYDNAPMPEADRKNLTKALKEQLGQE